MKPEEYRFVRETFHDVCDMSADDRRRLFAERGIPKHIVEEVHGGSLVVESELGVGSTFKVTLPKLGVR